jgi:hypothetical protein
VTRLAVLFAVGCSSNASQLASDVRCRAAQDHIDELAAVAIAPSHPRDVKAGLEQWRRDGIIGDTCTGKWTNANVDCVLEAGSSADVRRCIPAPADIGSDEL